jgi:LacI family transcriptional regulator
MDATLDDVARRAGVSKATASRVINNSPYRVADDLRRRVLAAAEELNYVPNAHAQALVRSATRTIGVIVHDVSDPYFSEIVRGIQRVAADNGRLVMICNTFRDLDRELAYVRLLHAQRVEAIIFAGSGLDDREFCQKLVAQLDAFSRAGGRVTMIGRHHVPGDAVLPDNAGGARALAQTLLALGHRRFGVISGPPLLTTTRDRLHGFRSALAEAGISLAPTQIVAGDFSRDSGFAATFQLLDQALEITAIFALNDQMAIGALAALRERGKIVPDDISVAGFDNIALTQDVTPALTTVQVPMEEIGARAMTLALQPQTPELRVEHYPTTVTVRSSTAAAPDHARTT